MSTKSTRRGSRWTSLVALPTRMLACLADRTRDWRGCGLHRNPRASPSASDGRGTGSWHERSCLTVRGTRHRALAIAAIEGRLGSPLKPAHWPA
jgi:hypothetical protein